MDSFMSLPNGSLFDRFGTTVARLLAISLYTTGALFVAFSSPALSFLLYPALPCIAMGGLLLQITNIQVGNLFGAHRSTVITLIVGADKTSTALFLVFKARKTYIDITPCPLFMYESGISLMVSFVSLAAFSVVHLLRTFLLLPKDKIPHPLPDSYMYGEDAPPPPPEKSFRECVFSWLFLWHLVWLSVLQLRHYLFIGTLNSTLERLAEDDLSLVSQYTNVFACTQVFGVLCSPWNGLIMDRNKGKPRAAGQSKHEADLSAAVLSLGLTVLQCLLFSICASIPLLPLQYLTFVLQVINWSFLYGCNTAVLSVAFPPAHFGKLYGLIMALGAIFSLLQYACFILIHEVLGGDPLYVDIALTLLCLFAFISPIYIHLHCRRMAAQRAQSAGAAVSL
ncbi:hypothetical protein CRUP_010298 [Coryphaenoides rupestris]|nr:hypothetical protein CRUP_010298 [Coryphaenoides rupestris]